MDGCACKSQEVDDGKDIKGPGEILTDTPEHSHQWVGGDGVALGLEDRKQNQMGLSNMQLFGGVEVLSTSKTPDEAFRMMAAPKFIRSRVGPSHSRVCALDKTLEIATTPQL
ncbi:unnamed protein product [Parascedosporium putredinis]|uniref:Uncharacterized protein n=1 Tax=Parascedosporium putredinis TaxID=1442378 RepID=A0A9P1HCC7_9PEZI|nr:unnamed protein product [Parascedosporium putredinis]CAI8004645.1 unnamed protein product [Parascedosporium putredinis]